MEIAYKLISYNVWKKQLTRAEITKTPLKKNSIMLLILHRRRSSPSIILGKYSPRAFTATSWLQQQRHSVKLGVRRCILVGLHHCSRRVL